MPAIRAEALTKEFAGATAVDRLTFQVEEGELFGLVGPDGAGKSTTMRLLTSVMAPTSGDAWVTGHHVVAEAAAVKLAIGYVSQRFGLYSDLTVAENIDFHADIYCVERAGLAARVDGLLEFADLAAFRKRLAGNLSGGMQQKLALVCALVHTPKVLFLDEPTNGVDPVSRRDFWRILYELLKEGVTIFVSTPYLDEAERCSRVALMHKGRLLACDSPDEVKRLVTGATLEVTVKEGRHAVELLRKGLDARSVGLFGERIHIVADDADAAQRKALDILRDAGYAAEIRAVEPSLEDVFVSAVAGEQAP